MRRREFITFLGGATAAWPIAARAQQQPSRLRRIAVLMAFDQKSPEAQGWVGAFQKALSKLGWTEGQNTKSAYRWIGTDIGLMQQASQELVASQPDLIISSTSPATAMFVRETSTIPIVFVNIVDPVGQGFAASLSRPGGNATGLVNLEPSMAGKWIELLKEIMPGVRRVAIPFNPATSPYADFYLNYFKSTATSFGAEVAVAQVPDIAAFETFAAAQAHDPNTGLVAVPSAFMQIHGVEIAAMMARYKLPAIHFDHTFVEARGLLAYGNDVTDNYRRAATFVDRILKGEKPSDLPIQFPVKFELAINLKTAKALGLTVPPQLIATADEVIE